MNGTKIELDSNTGHHSTTEDIKTYRWFYLQYKKTVISRSVNLCANMYIYPVEMILYLYTNKQESKQFIIFISVLCYELAWD